MDPIRIGIVGIGHVGMAAAFALFQSRAASEIVLVDLDHTRAEGEAMDLIHGGAYVGRVHVTAGAWADLAGSQVVVVTAGVGQRPGEDRLSLLERNVGVFRSIATELDTHCPDAVVIVATNPVDILTHALQELSSRPRERVLGTGTTLDTSRLRVLLGEHYDVDPRSVHAYVMGEHGDSEVAVWSSATIGGAALTGTVNGRPHDRAALDDIAERVRRAAYDIIERKGYTNLAIGLVLSSLVQTVLDDQRSVLPVSTRLEGEYGLAGVCMGVPCVVGSAGTGARVPPPVDAAEQAALERSAAVLRDQLAALDLTG